MKNINHLASIIMFGLMFSFSLSSCAEKKNIGETMITKWQFDKAGAVSLTFDDGIHTQFTQALPMMEELKLPATFFVITGSIAGSDYLGRFIGRSTKEIIDETVTVPTNIDNFFERTSAARYLGYKGTLDYYDEVDDLYGASKKQEAYNMVDELYMKVRNGVFELGMDTSMEIANAKALSWDIIENYALQGYEFGSHTVTHARLAMLDTANMLYELQKSKADILKHLGAKYTFSAEVPFGIEDPRVMKVALSVYPALRNRMIEPYMKEINRGNETQPGTSGKEYVQWQRGPLSKTSLSLMKSWIDTTLAHDNVWLVLVFHGVDEMGWEPITHELLDAYFQYIKKNEDQVWIASFGDVTRYIRERMSAKISSSITGGKIKINLTHDLDKEMYNLDLTLKTYVSDDWDTVIVTQNNIIQKVQNDSDELGRFVIFQAKPNTNPVELSRYDIL